ncbi:pentapeptide repeat-containing protein [Corynebacterium matruchotii]
MVSATPASIIGALISTVVSATALAGATVAAGITPTGAGGLPVSTSGEGIIGNPRSTSTWFWTRFGLRPGHGSWRRHARLGSWLRSTGFRWLREGRSRGLSRRGSTARFRHAGFRGGPSTRFRGTRLHSTRFRGSTWFRSTRLDGARFRHTGFRGSTWFRSTGFRGRSRFDSTLGTARTWLRRTRLSHWG